MRLNLEDQRLSVGWSRLVAAEKIGNYQEDPT
jgi:hypothetical protein